MMKINKLNTIVILLLLLFSCSDYSIIEQENIKIFRYNEPTGITSLDPIYSNTKSNIWATNHIFNGLVQFDNNLELKPSIAKEWIISKDGLTYTFFLRNDVYFHESKYFSKSKNKRTRLVIAKDFVYSFNRLKGSPGDWVSKFILDDGIYAENDTTLIIRLNDPFPSFLNLLTNFFFSSIITRLDGPIVIPSKASYFLRGNFGENFIFSALRTPTDVVTIHALAFIVPLLVTISTPFPPHLISLTIVFNFTGTSFL